jgi:hypothetical protein
MPSCGFGVTGSILVVRPGCAIYRAVIIINMIIINMIIINMIIINMIIINMINFEMILDGSIM